MNQSKSKPDTRLTHIGDLGVKLDEKTVTIRGRLHTCTPAEPRESSASW